MSETPTPIKSSAIKPSASGKGPAKRGGLVLPPRGQALARLQDLEEESEPSSLPTEDISKERILTEGIDAVFTASSNAVNHQGSDAVHTASSTDQKPEPSLKAVTPMVEQPVQEPIVRTTVASSGHFVPTRAAREPTTRITVDMPDSLHRKISLLSAETRRSIKDLVIEALAATYFGVDTDSQQ